MTRSDEAVRYAITQPVFDIARSHLIDYRSRKNTKLPQNFWRGLSNKKDCYVNQNNQLGAKAAWCLETIGHIQDNFISVLLHIKAEEFREAWDLLEHCEKAIIALDRHFGESQDEFGIEHVRDHTRQLQELFQLKWGFSLGILFEDVCCSICQSRRTLRGDCDHEIGEIYNGMICANIVKRGSLLHVSLVDSPAHKYSVIWPEDETQFVVLKYLAEEMLSSWDAWKYHKETCRSRHPAFKNVGCSDTCPCGSDLKYRDCCMNTDTVPHFPHFQFTFRGEMRGQHPNLLILHFDAN